MEKVFLLCVVPDFRNNENEKVQSWDGLIVLLEFVGYPVFYDNSSSDKLR